MLTAGERRIKTEGSVEMSIGARAAGDSVNMVAP